MFNGFKDFMRRDKPDNNDDKGKSKKGMIILFAVFGIVILNVVIQFVSGDPQYRSDMLTYIKNNFYISPIDLGIIGIVLIILIIFKIRKKNKKE